MQIFQLCDISERLPESKHISQKRLKFYPQHLLEIRMFWYYKNKVRGDIFEEKKGISEQFC